MAGLPRAIQIVSDTSTESVRRARLRAEMHASKLGEPISSSNSHRKRRFSGMP